MKTKFSYKGVHNCEAVVLCCIDFRFWRETLDFVEKELGIKSFDFPKLPGSAKAINEKSDLAMQCISVPCDLHHVKKVVIVNHQDCGAYGGSVKFNSDAKAEQEFHEGELKKARNIIAEKYPNKEIILVYVKLINENEMEFVII